MKKAAEERAPFTASPIAGHLVTGLLTIAGMLAMAGIIDTWLQARTVSKRRS